MHASTTRDVPTSSLPNRASVGSSVNGWDYLTPENLYELYGEYRPGVKDQEWLRKQLDSIKDDDDSHVGGC